MVADNESGKSIASEVRTSSGMFLRKAQVSEACIQSGIINLSKIISYNSVESWSSSLNWVYCCSLRPKMLFHYEKMYNFWIKKYSTSVHNFSKILVNKLKISMS